MSSFLPVDVGDKTNVWFIVIFLKMNHCLIQLGKT